jgi:hypothetical protein
MTLKPTARHLGQQTTRLRPSVVGYDRPIFCWNLPFAAHKFTERLCRCGRAASEPFSIAIRYRLDHQDHFELAEAAIDDSLTT